MACTGCPPGERSSSVSAARRPPLTPTPRAALGELQVAAHATVIPAVGDCGVDEFQQRDLRGRRHAPRDPATQSQRPFPSASIKRTPISFSASESLAISARAAASSGSGPLLALTPGLDAANASNAPCRATWRNFMTVERSSPARSAAAAIVYSPRTKLNQICYFSLGERNLLPRRRLAPVPLPSD